MWLVWWMVASRYRAHGPESAAAILEEQEDQIVAAVETPVAADPPAESTPVASEPAPTGLSNTALTRLDAAPPPAVPVVTAILMTEGRRLAVIDGSVLGSGQRVWPWELVSVNRDHVVLRDPSGIEHVVWLGQ